MNEEAMSDIGSQARKKERKRNIGFYRNG